MIRILQAHSHLDWGGVEVWLMQVMERLDPGAFQMDFFATHVHPEFGEKIRRLGGSIVTAPLPSRVWRYLPRLREVLRSRGPYAAIHSHFVDHSGYILREASRCGVPVRIAHSHLDLLPVLAKASLPRRAYFEQNERWVHRHATCGLAASANAARTLYGDNWRADSRFEVLPCGVDLQPFRSAEDARTVRAELNIPPEAFVIGHVGRFIEQKNHALLRKIVKETVRRIPRALFLLIGQGRLEEDFRKELERDGNASSVRILNQRSDVPRLMRHAMDAFVFPSLFEGLGLALVEAQAAGLPCVVSDTVPEEADVIPELVRRLPLSETPGRWAEAIASTVGVQQPVSPKAALRRVEDSCFNALSSVRSLERKYMELCPQPACV